MRGPPVVLTNTLGRPVTNVISERGAVPMTVVNTLGEPVTLVASGGEPVTLFNANGTLWDYPFSLFANNEQGAWYDPSDFSTLFQNSTGTTPVTAVEQPVRLMLDRSRGLVLGGELVTNGGFDSATGWTLGAGWSISGGQLLYPTGAGVTDATQNIITANRLYVMEIDVASLSGSTLLVFVGSSTFVTITTIGVHRFQLFTTGDNRLIIRPNATSTNVAINSISVRELPGAHATAPNDASRPVLRSRYNLLTYSEQFDNAAWAAVTTATVTANAIAAPDGTLTADLISASSSSFDARGQAITVTAATVYSVSVFIKQGTATRAGVSFFDQTGGDHQGFVQFDWTAGVPSTAATTGSPSNITYTPISDGWYRLSFTVSSDATNTSHRILIYPDRIGTTGGTYFWGAQLLTSADQAATGGAYQRIAAATVYDTSNPVWRPYLAFDGSDDSLSTSAIDFSGTDEMTVFAGVTKLSDAAQAVVVGFGNITQAGAFELFAPTSAAGNDFNFAANGGTTFVQAVAGSRPSPITVVASGVMDFALASGEVITRINGASAATSSGDAGSGNFGNYALQVGSRGGSSLRLNGRLTSLIVLGRTATAAEISATEQWVAGKTGVTL